MKKRLLIFGILVLGWVFCAYAQETNTEPDYTDEATILIAEDQGVIEQAPPGATFSIWDFVRMVLVLGAVLGAVYLLFRVLKKAGGPRFENPDLISMHATLGVGSNRTLHLVEVGGEFYLIGSSDSSVNLVSKITEKEAVDQIRFKLSTEKTEAVKNFSDILSRLFQPRGGGNKNGGVDNTLGKSRDFLEAQKDRLKNL